MYAQTAVSLINAYAASIGMKSETVAKIVSECFDIVDEGSHKYIPSDTLSEQLGLPSNAGVYGYTKFADGSYLLKLCDFRIAWWSGKYEDQPSF